MSTMANSRRNLEETKVDNGLKKQAIKALIDDRLRLSDNTGEEVKSILKDLGFEIPFPLDYFKGEIKRNNQF